jgi:hypothetical protein
LRDDIRAPIALHHPSIVNNASALALLQEEELESRKRFSTWKSESMDYSKFASKGFSGHEKAKPSLKKEEPKKFDKPATDSKCSYAIQKS